MSGWGVCLAISLVALLGTASAGGALPQSSVVGSGSGHFVETGGPFELTVNARGKGPLAQGHVRGSGDYAASFRVQVYIEDNGKPVKGEPVDRVATEPPQPPESFAVRDAG
jgi:hypothetical protein